MDLPRLQYTNYMERLEINCIAKLTIAILRTIDMWFNVPNQFNIFLFILG